MHTIMKSSFARTTNFLTRNVNNNKNAVGISTTSLRFASVAAGTLTNPTTPSLIKLHQPYVGERAATEELLLRRAKQSTKLSKEQLLIKKRVNKLEIIKAKRDTERCWDQVSRTLDDMRILGVSPTYEVYNEAINALVRAKRVDKAHTLIERMRNENIAISNSLLCYMINACKFSQEPGKAQTYMNELLANLERDSEIQTDEQKQANAVLLQNSFTNLINVYARTEDIAGVQKTFNLMKESGVSPDTVTYGAVLKVYGRLYRLNDALELVEEMRSNDIAIDTVVYNLLIKSCKVPDEVDRAHEFFNAMETENLPRDAITYGTIMSKMMHAEDYESVYSYYEKFKQTKMRATPFMFETLLKTCLKDGLSKPIRNKEQMLEDARELGLRVFVLPKSDIDMRRVRQYWTDMTHKYNWRASKECADALNNIIEIRKEHKKLFKEEHKAASQIVDRKEKEALDRQLHGIKESTRQTKKKAH